MVPLKDSMYKDANSSHSYHLVQASFQVDLVTLHKIGYTQTNRRKVGKSLKHMGTGENFLYRTPMTYALRSRIDKWDLIKLQSVCKAKDCH